MIITETQKQLMRHAVSEPGRNWFGTNADSPDGQEFEKLVDAGFATKTAPVSWMGNETIYRLTDEGKRAI